MNEETGSGSDLSPDEAFAAVANETRIAILRTLGEADEPLSFSELFDQIDYDSSANFSYHLETLEGHFVERIDDGYRLRQAGRRVLEAVLSGVVTDAPVLEPTEIDEPCPFCGASIAVSFQEEHVDIFCPDCDGTYGRVGETLERDLPADHGHIGAVHLPPAGTHDRSAHELIRAALAWGNIEFLAVSSGVCPRCSGKFAESVAVCETHDPADGFCPDCGYRHAVQIEHRCPICQFHERGGFWNALWAETAFLSFLTDNGINPIAPSPGQYSALVASFEETVRSVDPFEAQFTYTIDDESITLTVDDQLEVVEATRAQTAETP